MLEKQSCCDSKSKGKNSVGASHPDHSRHLNRLNRAKGQIEGIEKMILDRRYCPDIMMQIKAATSALKAIEAEIFRSHLEGCVQDAFQTKNQNKVQDKIEEIMKIVF